MVKTHSDPLWQHNGLCERHHSCWGCNVAPTYTHPAVVLWFCWRAFGSGCTSYIDVSSALRLGWLFQDQLSKLSATAWKNCLDISNNYHSCGITPKFAELSFASSSNLEISRYSTWQPSMAGNRGWSKFLYQECSIWALLSRLNSSYLLLPSWLAIK